MSERSKIVLVILVILLCAGAVLGFRLLRLTLGISQPKAASVLIEELKTNGCMWAGLVDAHPDIHLPSELPIQINTLKRSNCKHLFRAIDTWDHAPNFVSIRNTIRSIREQTGRDFIYNMSIGEHINPSVMGTYTYLENGVEKTFNFQDMCSTVLPGNTSGCIPSFRQPEYLRYVKYIMRQAIDIGVHEFIFGNINKQEDINTTMDSSTVFVAPEILQEIRAYAASKNVSILIGMQGVITFPSSYVSLFDFVVAPLYQYTDGSFGDEACSARNRDFADNDENNPNLIYCSGIAWWNNAMYLAKANNVIVELDWFSATYDDVHIFTRMNDATKTKLLTDAYGYFKNHQSGKLGFLMPFMMPIGGQSLGDECYGPHPYSYAASQEYTHSRACKDEDIISSILGVFIPSPSPTPSPAPLTCTPRFQITHVGQEVTLDASGGTGSTDYLWLTPGNTRGPSTNGPTVHTSYNKEIPNSRRVTLVRGTQQKHCVVYIVP